ncbi:hypothetical protein B0H10DRAFT_1943011 [Mycena sp. CBHHK59/15]|nr:hypothetical protein B0H10DRAFT_1943011 [Mycena sp. CBHHK59/15]
MSPVERPEDRVEPAEVFMPTYWRHLSQSELSYFLPSRAHGLNDLFLRVTFHALPALVSPFRLRIVWAIMRLRHTLLACKTEMSPGCCGDAPFTYTPPSSPEIALEQAEETLSIHDDKTALELHQECLDGPRKLSTDCLSHLEITRRHVAPGLDEYDMILVQSHAVNACLTTHKHGNMILELLGGSAAPGGLPRTDVELAQLLEISAAAIQLPGGWCKVDHQNVQRRVAMHYLASQVRSLSTSKPTTTSSSASNKRPQFCRIAVFALSAFARIRIEEDDVHCSQSRTLSGRCIAAVIVYVPGAQIMSVEGGSRAKAFARQDDEAYGTLPPSATKSGVLAVDQSIASPISTL